MSNQTRSVPCLYKLKEDVPGSWWKKSDEQIMVRLKCGSGHISKISEDLISADGDVDDFQCPKKDCEYEGALNLVDYR